MTIEIFDTDEVAGILAVSARTVRRLADKHGVGTRKKGGYLFTSDDVETMRGRPTVGRPKNAE